MSLVNWELEQANLSNRIKTAYMTVPKNPSLGQLRARFEALEKNWSKFQIQHTEVLGNASELLRSLGYFKDNIYSATEEYYLNSKANFLDALSLVENNIQAAQTSVKNVAKRLPNLDLPTFSGNYIDWSSFRDLFIALVHNNSGLEPVEKLAYLKAHVSGDAAIPLKNIPISADNYQRAWTLLESRYSNIRLLVSSYLSTLMSLKPVKSESVVELSHLFNTTIDCVEALASLKRPVTEWSDWLVFITVEKLDKQSRKDWESHIGSSTDFPTFAGLKEFLQIQIRTYESYQASLQLASVRLSQNHSSQQSKANQSKFRPNQGKSFSVAQTHVITGSTEFRSTPRKCFLCNDFHFLMYCSKFKDQTVSQRVEFVNSKNLCTNCFGFHSINDCRSKSTCRICQEKHHTMIHPGSTMEVLQPSTAKSNMPHANINTVIIQPDARQFRSTLLATAKVRVCSSDGTSVLVRALIDPCSEVTLISESLAQGLHLKRTSSSVIIVGVMKSISGPTRGSVSAILSPWFQSDFELPFNALVLPHLSSYTPKNLKVSGTWPDCSDGSLADPDFSESKSIDLILGVDLYGLILLPGLRKGDPTAPIAQDTRLGWILSGPTAGDSSVKEAVTCCHTYSDSTLEFDLQQFWEEQELQMPSSGLTKEEQECEEDFASTHSRSADGAYIVRLPFKQKCSDIGDSFTPSYRMLQVMERRFVKNSVLFNAYSDFLKEYESLDHMEPINTTISNQNFSFFLPHHGVIRDTSLTTKLRVVFNGSQKTDKGISLNEILHPGPRLQPNLADIIMRWRLHCIVFAADIEKMFRQIRIHPEDQDWQRILWRLRPEDPVKVFRLKTVTYGLTCSPYLALRTIRQLAMDEKQRFPLASSVLLKDIYVDDVLSGSDDVLHADILQCQLRELCMAGGFPLRKFSSNSSALMDLIPEELHTPSPDIFWESNTSLSILGLKWQPQDDVFVFPIKLSSLPAIVTKRVVISLIAQLYDPLGLLAPVIIIAKIFIQSLWLLKLSWDDPLPSDYSDRWDSFYSSLSGISEIHIPRWLNFYQSKGCYELHGFSDASEFAYSAVVYLRSKLDDTQIVVSLITSKTRVAPLKKISIPRLELNGALLLSELVRHTMNSLELQLPIHLWTDSTVVLAWISKQPSCWPTFVSNRVSAIQTLLPTAVWHHISTSNNPADCASRGLFPQKLLNNSLWWNGPSFLTESTYWPASTSSEVYETTLELKNPQFASHLADIEFNDLLNRYSSLNKLLRITSYCFRFLFRFRKRLSHSSFVLTPQELQFSKTFWIKHEQAVHFSAESSSLRKKLPISPKSRLLSLAPFLDTDDILRVGGRLKHSSFHNDEKHPSILPSGSPFTTLVIRDCHHRCLHGGVQLTLNTLRQEYWILRGRAEVKKLLNQCVICRRFRATPLQQIMSDLPIRRVTESRPFSHSGVDYAGPIQLRTTRGRGHRSYKGWISVFVCFSTRAVHIEVVSDYTSDAFLAAFRRFISRRGICLSLSSDQGRTFIGADKELQQLFSSASLEFQALATSLADLKTEWRFNPPAAPHFGGLWEAAVKSMKFHLKRAIGDSTLTFEEMSTLLSQVEACLNSRPLQAISDDPDDLDALTPGHFLIGQPLNAVPEPTLANLPSNRLSRWQYIQQLRSYFWKRWSADYLKLFQVRSKWTTPTSELAEGDLVLILGENLPPTKWPLGRVLQLHQGRDQHVRVATIKTKTGQLVRPIVKLCKFLSINDSA